MPRSIARRAVAAGLVSAACALALPSLAPAADGTFSGCRASAASIQLLNSTPIETTVANAPGSPCIAETKSAGTPASGGTVSLGASSATTLVNTGGSSADARVADVGLNIAPGVAVGVSAVNAQASWSCVAGVPVPAGHSQVAGVTLLGATINIVAPDAPLTVNLGIAVLKLNQRVVTATSVTQTALELSIPLLGTRVVLGQSTASISGNPCTTSGVPNPPTETPPTTTPTPPSTTPPGSTGPGQTIFVPVPGFTAGGNTNGAVTPGSCATKRFVFNVRGRGMASTTYFLDGKRVKKVGRNVSSGLPVDPSKLSPGAHRIRAVVTFVGGKVKPKTINFSFLNCGGQGISIISPANFGRCANLKVTSTRAGAVFVGLYSGQKSIRAFAQALVTFTRPGVKRFCLPIPPGARTFIPRTTRKFATLTKVGGANFISRVRTS